MYIGIDVGTSSVKLILMHGDGRIEATVSKDYPVSYPQTGWSEQQPEDWYNQTMAGLQALLRNVDATQVKGLSFGGQMHGLVILDAQDAVIRPAILWNDGRTSAEVAYLNDTIGRDKLSALTGNIAFAGFTAPKLLWLKAHEPENFARIHKIMLPKDYLAYRLTGVHCTDPSDASGMLLFDVKRRCWSQEMLAICGVEERMMPTVYESYEKVGTLKPDIANALGLADVTVAAGAGDNAAAAVGTGTVGDGQCNISLGTSGTVFIASDRFKVDDHNALHAFAHADGHYHLMGCMLSAASCGKWWIEDILGTNDYDAEQAAITALGDNNVYFLPYLMGERSPHNDADARGMFIGMSANTTRAQMTQAVFEGVTFALRDSLEVAKSLGIPITKTRLCGGGAKSRLWRLIITNVLGLEVELLQAEEGPALGAAILACVACGEYESVSQAADRIVSVTETLTPDATLVAKYSARYQTFQRLYPAVKAEFANLH